MRFKTKYLICLYKSYFDKGLALTNYLKYLIAFFALASMNIAATFVLAISYALFCFILGYWWFKSGFYKAEIEVCNRYNLFVGQMRKKIKSKKFK